MAAGKSSYYWQTTFAGLRAFCAWLQAYPEASSRDVIDYWGTYGAHAWYGGAEQGILLKELDESQWAILSVWDDEGGEELIHCIDEADPGGAWSDGDLDDIPQVHEVRGDGVQQVG